MSEITTILTSEGKSIVKDLRDSMKTKGLDASGDTSRSIDYTVEETLTKSTLKITSNRSIGALQFGRRPGRRPPLETILRWIDTKPITPEGNISKKSLAFLIQRKIGRDGIKVPNVHNVGGVLSDVINDQRIDQIFTEVKRASINRFIAATKKIKGGFAK